MRTARNCSIRKATFTNSTLQVVILATQTRDVLPELWNNDSDLAAEDSEAVAVRAAADIEHLIGSLRSRSNAHLILNTLEMPSFPNAGILDSQANYTDNPRRFAPSIGIFEKLRPNTWESTYLTMTL